MPQRKVLPSALSNKKDQLLKAVDTPEFPEEPTDVDSQSLPKKYYVKDDNPDPEDPVVDPKDPVVSAPPTDPVTDPVQDLTLQGQGAMSEDEQIAFWKSESDKNEQRWKTHQGQWKSRETQLTDKIEALSRRLDDQPTDSKPEKPLKFDVDMTDEERTTFQQSSAFITKVASQVANQAISHMMERLEAIEAQLGGVRQSVEATKDSFAQTTEAAFNTSVRGSITDLDALTGHAMWRPYSARIAPLSGQTVGANLLAAYDRQDLSTVVAILDDFRSSIKTEKPPGFESLAVPESGKSASAGANGSVKSSPKRLKFSLRKQASDDFRKGRIDAVRFAKIKAAFKHAEQNDLVDFDA